MIIRLLTSQMKNRTLARLVSVIIWSIAALDIVHVLIPVLNLLNSIDLTVGSVNLTVLSLIQGGLILVVLFWLAKKISVFFEHWIKTVQNVTPSVQVLLYKLLSITLFTLVIVGVLYYLGINLTAFAVFSGGIGLGIGFGLQKVFANLISGLIILADKSIKPGDVIQLGDTYGWINYLGGRYISVVTRDGKEHLIPNEDLITNQVVNWSYSNNLLRLKIPIGIGYDSRYPAGHGTHAGGRRRGGPGPGRPRARLPAHGFWRQLREFSTAAVDPGPAKRRRQRQKPDPFGGLGAISGAWHRPALPAAGLASQVRTRTGGGRPDPGGGRRPESRGEAGTAASDVPAG